MNYFPQYGMCSGTLMLQFSNIIQNLYINVKHNFKKNYFCAKIQFVLILWQNYLGQYNYFELKYFGE